MTNDGSVVSLGVLSVPAVTTSTVYASGGTTYADAPAAQTAALDAAFLALLASRHPAMDPATASAILASAQCDFDAISAYSTLYAAARAGTMMP